MEHTIKFAPTDAPDEEYLRLEEIKTQGLLQKRFLRTFKGRKNRKWYRW